MIEPTKHPSEEERLKELHSFSIMDTLPENEYEDLTLIASQICNTPISLISLIDDSRQWFKSNRGLQVRETPKEHAFCAHAINKEGVFVVKDARTDERFHDNPLVTGDPNVIFYAGAPLITETGLPLGTLCVIDNQPRELNSMQKDSLTALSNQAMTLLVLRKKKAQLKKALLTMERRNEYLENFAETASKNIKSPLNEIIASSQMMKKLYSDQLDERGNSILNQLEENSKETMLLIGELVAKSKE